MIDGDGEKMDETKYRFVLNTGGKVTYFSGVIIEQNEEYITINEVKEGKVQFLKSNLITRRVLDDE